VDADVRQVLDSYFRTDAGRAFMEDGIEEVRRGRQAFLAEFGYEKLRSLGRNQLLEVIPISQANPQSLDYWLEFRSDSVFNNRRYGSIAGGSQAKFGTWQDKRTGEWQALPNPRQGKHSITEAEAIEIVAVRRDELVAASEVLAGVASQPLGQINGRQLHDAIAAVTPRWCTSAWFHKYLHLTFPRLITSYNTHHHTKAQLVRLGIVPSSNHFERDIQIMQAWESVPSLGSVGDDVRARAGRILSPRDVLVVTVGDVGAARTMISRGVVSLGPSYVGAISTKTIEDGIRAVQRQIMDASLKAKEQIGRAVVNDLALLATRSHEGTVVAIATPKEGVVGIGIGASLYRHVAGDPTPHQASVHWHLHDSGLAPSVRVTATGVASLAEDDPNAVAVEASLVAGRIGPWPGFMSTVVDLDPIIKPDPNPSPLPPLDAVAADVETMLERKGQVILYGPPGTGKTYHAERVALELVARRNYRKVGIDLTAEERVRVYGTDDVATAEIVTCTFHPAYGYEDFVEGFRPAGEGFRIESGVFRRVVDAALRAPERQFILIIDEINRGNIPRIFGELITLVEKSKRGSTQITLATSKNKFTVPPNLWIIGAMNTADRSIMLLDTALRRRFAFRELLPEPALLRGAFIGDVGLGTWLRSLNAGIREVLGHDGRNLQVGHAYFLEAGRPVQTMKQIGAIIRDEIWPLLQEYCYEDPAKLTALLGADRRGIYDAARGDLRRELFKPGHEEELASALLAVITKRETLDDDDSEDDSEEEAPIIPPPVVENANPTAGLEN
jgi:5-methylcytosine-specific restriction protein B